MFCIVVVAIAAYAAPYLPVQAIGPDRSGMHTLSHTRADTLRYAVFIVDTLGGLPPDARLERAAILRNTPEKELDRWPDRMEDAYTWRPSKLPSKRWT